MDNRPTILVVPENPDTDTFRVPVLEVFDGDGFLSKITDERRNLELEVMIRFGFTDAPEIEQRGGPEAKEFLKFLITGQWIDLVILTKSDTGKVVDRHGRIVAIPYLTQNRGGDFLKWPSDNPRSRTGFDAVARITRNIELEMIVNGWTWVLDRYGPDEVYFAALEDARHNRRGIWAFDNNVHPWEFKRQKYRKGRRHHISTHEHDLFFNEIASTVCPIQGCGGRLLDRKGRFGKFLGCSNYPDCRYTHALPG